MMDASISDPAKKCSHEVCRFNYSLCPDYSGAFYIPDKLFQFQ